MWAISTWMGSFVERSPVKADWSGAQYGLDGISADAGGLKGRGEGWVEGEERRVGRGKGEKGG